ncbi:class I SAM-dependent methyltransferase [Gymnodinialimonas sp. 57CJ19]|uniref:class I SAM-dependent methyltransferase n=1 Tax=Gymnodinialimonas sp. 57CJ19 TaxID=3138498 RepID=UPI003134470E
MGPEDILATYGVEAAQWARQRSQDLWERPALEACVAERPAPLRVLDLGCGAGQPIAQWFVTQGHDVTGVDGVAEMLAECATRVPEMRRVMADMRGLDLAERFDIILAFNSFFHLSMVDQRAMFPTFAAHAADDARLLFTSGPDAGEAMGTVGTSPVYHASLAPDEYRALLAENGFEVIWFRPEDAALRGHSVWLARSTGV